MYYRLTVKVLIILLICVNVASANLLVNGDAETGNLTGWSDPLGNGFTILDTSMPFGHPVFAGSFSFWAGGSGASGVWTNEIRQDVDLTALAAQIDAGLATSQFSGVGRTFADSPGVNQDDAEIGLEFLDSAGGNLATFTSGVILPINTWIQVSDSRTIPVGTRTLRVRLLGSRDAGVSTDSFFDALSLSVVTDCALNCPAGDASGVIGLSNRSPDIDGDGAVGLTDLSSFAQAFPPNPYDTCADFDCDGEVNVADLSIFAQHFLHTGVAGVCN